VAGDEEVLSGIPNMRVERTSADGVHLVHLLTRPPESC